MKRILLFAVLFCTICLISCNPSQNETDKETSTDTATENNQASTDSVSRTPEEAKALFQQSIQQLDNYFSQTIPSFEEKLETAKESNIERTKERISSLKEGQKILNDIKERAQSGAISWEEGLTEIQKMVKEKGISPVSFD